MARCPHCRRVLRDPDLLRGTCVTCGRVLPARGHGADPSQSGAGGRRWAWQAACLSVLAPAAVLVLDGVFRKQAALDPERAQQAATYFGILAFLLIGVLVLGLAALAASVRAKAWQTAGWAVLGVLANGGVLAAWAVGAIFKAP